MSTLSWLYFVLVPFNAFYSLEEFAGVRSYLASARSFHLSEEIAFYQGEKREKQTIDSTFQRLVRLRIEKKSNRHFLMIKKNNNNNNKFCHLPSVVSRH